MEMHQGDRAPRWHNPMEVAAVKEIVKLLQPDTTAKQKPRLAILSPYSEQVRRLRRAIDEQLDDFPNLAGFEKAIEGQNFAGTVDSFQGNQADVVVVSLVRNNHHSSVRSALGFLTEQRRMNVLLSRARWRLIIVTSLSFLAAIMKAEERRSEVGGQFFLKTMLSNIEEERVNRGARYVKYEDIIEKISP